MKYQPASAVGLALPAIASVMLAACGVTGKGLGPVGLVIHTATGAATSNSVARAFVCFATPLSGYVDFSDGTAADYTGRIVWSSSNPGVAEVSNGDILQPDSTADYAYGTVIPHNPGTTVITADFQGLTQQLTVSVGAPTDFTIVRQDQGLPTAVTALSVGVGTTQNLKVDATLDGVVKDVSAYTFWSVAAPGLASIDSASGLLKGLGAGGPTRVIASFPICGENTTLPLTVSDLNRIEIDPEFGADALIVGDDEKMNVMADLADGTQEDVSLQATLSSEDPDVADFSPLDANSLPDILTAAQPGAVQVMASLNDTYQAAPVTVTVVSAALQSIVINPASATLTAGSSQIVPFRASGTFDNGQVQDVTRVVTWTSDNTAVATVGSTPANAGQAVSASGQSALVNISATGAGAGIAATATLAVNGP